MSELPEGVQPAEPPTPIDSASGLVLRRTVSGTWAVLLGRRSRESRFMPGQRVFPGGAVDAVDRSDEPGGYARCASRELAEETGLAVAEADWIEAGHRTTPPMFPVRYHNRFFLTVLPEEVDTPLPATTEFERLDFVRPDSVLADWRNDRQKVPPPMLPILRTLARRDRAEPQALAEAIRETNDLEQRSPRIEFCPDVWMLPVRTETLPPATHTNVWMPGVEQFVVVDPGAADAAEIDRLMEVIARRSERGRPVAVVLTHHHHDHVGGARELSRRLGLPLRAHSEVLRRLAGEGGLPIDDGEELSLGETTLRAFHTPGHAPGHLCFLVGETRVAIVGDLISALSTILIDPDNGDMDDYLASLRRVRDLGCEMLLPGHGPPLPGRAIDRLIDHREQREATVFEGVESRGTTLADIARAAYRDVRQMPAALTERQTLSHLIRLEKRGRVRRGDREGRSWSAC